MEAKGPSLSLSLQQVYKCPKCKTGTLTMTDAPDKIFVCDQCDYVLWNYSIIEDENETRKYE